jgi:hypothetical protein
VSAKTTNDQTLKQKVQTLEKFEQVPKSDKNDIKKKKKKISSEI